MNADLFIDWVDVEWCDRASHVGLQLLLDGDAILPHRNGQKSATFMGRHFHVHSPFRYYLFCEMPCCCGLTSGFQQGTLCAPFWLTWFLHLVGCKG